MNECQRCDVGLEEDDDELGSWNLEVDFFDCLVKYLEGIGRSFWPKLCPCQECRDFCIVGVLFSIVVES